MVALFAPPVRAAGIESQSVDAFAKRSLTEWIVRGETLPASPVTLDRMISDLPASVRLAREVTGLDYQIASVDTGDFELRTPRGLIARIHPIRRVTSGDTGIFEAVGYGEFRRAGGVFVGLYAMRFKYERRPLRVVRGDFEVYIDVQNRILRFIALLARGIITSRMTAEMDRMLSEAKLVMAAAEGGHMVNE